MLEFLSAKLEQIAEMRGFTLSVFLHVLSVQYFLSVIGYASFLVTDNKQLYCCISVSDTGEHSSEGLEEDDPSKVNESELLVDYIER